MFNSVVPVVSSLLVGFTLVTSLAHAATEATQPTSADDAAIELERIRVQGQFRQLTVNETPTSVATISASMVAERGAMHLDEVLQGVANVNFAGGSSRARFIQIRGIGERSQFVDPINPSVGLLIDGINYSGLGQAAQLFDISQVEIYRGPQSGRFGADGMAGMLVLESTRAKAEHSGEWLLGIANYGGRRAGLALGGAVGALGDARLSIYQQRDDGFTENLYLQRDDTQQRSERAVRLNVFTELGSDWSLRSTLHSYRQDNGYDAFSLDNTRQSYADQPGEDDLTQQAVRFAATFSGWQYSELLLAYSYLNADSKYSYDEDWSYPGIAPGWEYASVDSYQRQRQDHSVEVRWLSTQPQVWLGLPTDWVLGLYAYQRDEDMQRDFMNWDIDQQDRFVSSYQSRHLALYGELVQQLSDRWQLTTGLRLERYRNPYQDSNQVAAKPSDSMWGGRLSLSYQTLAGGMWYSTLARGYKTGGVNGEALGKVSGQLDTELGQFLQQRATFAPELLTSYELGYKYINDSDTLLFNAALFYQDRNDVQLKSWINRQQQFVGYIENAASGNSYGAELELRYRFTEQLQSFAALGWLESDMQGFVTEDGVDMSGRELAYAPNHQANVGITWQPLEQLSVTLQTDYKDSFYYSDSHNSRSAAVQLWHASVDWQLADWHLSLWARNLSDQDYGIRGFYFGNDPRIEYAPQTYEQWGEPRRVGFTASYSF
ncbi:TonB-dependent receptor [Pseudidiomarina sp. PP-1MA]|uniref:TonB-dependent receptor n=1 Tax=Pseudidiomarina sp. PP-1MA TaxID=3237706 RepID=A0AB39X5Z6_9GAMM